MLGDGTSVMGFCSVSSMDLPRLLVNHDVCFSSTLVLSNSSREDGDVVAAINLQEEVSIN